MVRFGYGLGVELFERFWFRVLIKGLLYFTAILTKEEGAIPSGS